MESRTRTRGGTCGVTVITAGHVPPSLVVSGQTEQNGKSDSKLSPATLAIASAASVAAAIFVHEVWNGGAIVGAAITPIIVAVVSESLKKPTQKISAVTPVIRPKPARPGRTRAPEAVEAQAVELQREDRFGIWEDEKRRRSPWHKLSRRHLKIALVTGVLAFGVGALALTAAELVFGGSVGSSGDRVTIIPGGSKKKSEPATTVTTPAEEEQAPEDAQTEPVPQEEDVPPATTPTTPPATTQPAPAPQSGATPAPAEPDAGATPPAPSTPVP
jgi:hypothetical protein